MEVTNYMTMKCASSDTVLLAAAIQTVSYAQKTCSISTCRRCSQQTGRILNGKWSMMASSIEFRSFMTIMHTCSILS